MDLDCDMLGGDGGDRWRPGWMREGNRECGGGGGGGGAVKIAVIPKATTDEFWKSIHAGAAKGQEEANSDGQEGGNRLAGAGAGK